MTRETSFHEKKDAGWTMGELMRHYRLSDSQYDDIIICLADIKK